MTSLEYMEKKVETNRINYNRQVLRGAPEKQLQDIREKILHYEDAVKALKKVSNDG